MQPGLRRTDVEVSCLGYTVGPPLVSIRLQEAAQLVPVSQRRWRPLSSPYPPTSPSSEEKCSFRALGVGRDFFSPLHLK